MLVNCLGFECTNKVDMNTEHTCDKCRKQEEVMFSTAMCCVVGCTNAAAVKVNSDYLCLPCAKHEIPSTYKAEEVLSVHGTTLVTKPAEMICPDHWCEKHQVNTGEGDICHMCEAEFDVYRNGVNAEMAKHQYELWFVTSGKLFRCPVSDFDEAKLLFHAIRFVTGVRIARMDPEQGCESTLHEFN